MVERLPLSATAIVHLGRAGCQRGLALGRRPDDGGRWLLSQPYHPSCQIIATPPAAEAGIRPGCLLEQVVGVTDPTLIVVDAAKAAESIQLALPVAPEDQRRPYSGKNSAAAAPRLTA